MGVILTVCASAGTAASKRTKAAQAIFMSFLPRRLIRGQPAVARSIASEWLSLNRADDISRRRRMGQPFWAGTRTATNAPVALPQFMATNGLWIARRAGPILTLGGHC